MDVDGSPDTSIVPTMLIMLPPQLFLFKTAFSNPI